jgi:hypothetical protein
MTSDGEYLFSLERIGFSGQPYVLTHESIENFDPLVEDDYAKRRLVEESLDRTINQLMSGNNPAQIRDVLIQLSQLESFDCKEAYRCDQFQYLFGLTNELMGDEQAAIDAYLRLWNDYPDSLYTIMARAKLILTSPRSFSTRSKSSSE